MLLLWIRLLSRLGCKTDSGSFRANSLETSELLPAEVIALWKIHPQPWKRYPTPTQAGLWSSLLHFNDWYPMSVSCLLGHSLERHDKYLIVVSLQRADIYTLSTKQEENAAPLLCQIYSTTVVKVHYWCHKVRDTCSLCSKLIWDDVMYLIMHCQLLSDSWNKGAFPNTRTLTLFVSLMKILLFLYQKIWYQKQILLSEPNSDIRENVFQCLRTNSHMADTK